MKKIKIIFVLAIISFGIAESGIAQVESGSAIRKRSERDKKKTEQTTGVTERMQSFYESKPPHEADLSYLREIYRELDLKKAENSPLYYPEDAVDGKENLLRVILGTVVNGVIPAYEYLDGREIFSDKYKVNVGEMLDRFGIYYTKDKGSGTKNQKIHIDEADIPTSQVLNYYIIEKWEFDTRSNKMKTRVEAICPVMTRIGDFGGEAKYPMFWVKYDALRPYLAKQYVFVNDDNNIPQYSLDDYFNLGMYSGDIYKTKNLRNLSMAQIYPDEDVRKQAQDSIDNRLKNYGKNLWVPTREEFLANKAKEEEVAKALSSGDSIPGKTVVSEEIPTLKKTAGTKKRASNVKRTRPAKVSKPKSSSSNSQGNASAAKSVRRRKR